MVPSVRVTVELDRLNRKLEAYARAVELEVAWAAEQGAIGLVEILEETTPRDTGRARRSWKVIRYGEPFTWTYTDDLGNTYTATIVDGPRQPGEVVAATDVDYMWSLEAGHSQQAPTGFIRIALIAMRRRVTALIAQVEGRAVRRLSAGA